MLKLPFLAKMSSPKKKVDPPTEKPHLAFGKEEMVDYLFTPCMLASRWMYVHRSRGIRQFLPKWFSLLCRKIFGTGPNYIVSVHCTYTAPIADYYQLDMYHLNVK